MSRLPLMPQATAVWLVENTSLSFDQIAQFCNLHMLEVKGIADGDVAKGIKGMDPISSGQLTREEIQAGEENLDRVLRMASSKFDVQQLRVKKGPRYTPLMRRHDRPNAILWLVKNHPELKDSQIMRLVGTTKPTIEAIRTRSHWNSNNLTAQDPITLGLCTQSDLDVEVQKAAKRAEKAGGGPVAARALEGTLAPIEETVPAAVAVEDAEAAAAAADDLDPKKVLARMIANAAPAPKETEDADAESEETSGA